ncbi:MAG: sigma-70 family RNA polymerase sigma factor [Crocinitomicaceae bacterium]|nr:sigma-70 family RNA polymerase sigma factor [Crocinitomicaceae bacterium]
MKKRRNIKDLSEAQIVELAKKESHYFGALYDKYFEQIFRFVFKRLGGKEDEAGDITQQTFIKAMGNLNKYEDRGLPFSSWLYRIAQNEVSMFFRNKKKNYSVPIDENRIQDVAAEANLTSYMSIDEQEQLIEMLNEMEEEHLNLIELRFFQGLSFKEIAAIYSITEANAKMRTYRILERIGKKWNNNK